MIYHWCKSRLSCAASRRSCKTMTCSMCHWCTVSFFSSSFFLSLYHLLAHILFKLHLWKQNTHTETLTHPISQKRTRKNNSIVEWYIICWLKIDHLLREVTFDSFTFPYCVLITININMTYWHFHIYINVFMAIFISASSLHIISFIFFFHLFSFDLINKKPT